MTGADVDRRGAGRHRLRATTTSCSWLEDLLHPHVRAAVDDWAAAQQKVTAAARRSSSPRCRCCSRPAWPTSFDYVMLITAPDDVRRRRLTAKLTDSEFARRLAQQMPEEEKIARSDFVFDNTGVAQGAAGVRAGRPWRSILAGERPRPPRAAAAASDRREARPAGRPRAGRRCSALVGVVALGRRRRWPAPRPRAGTRAPCTRSSYDGAIRVVGAPQRPRPGAGRGRHLRREPLRRARASRAGRRRPHAGAARDGRRRSPARPAAWPSRAADLEDPRGQHPLRHATTCAPCSTSSTATRVAAVAAYNAGAGAVAEWVAAAARRRPSAARRRHPVRRDARLRAQRPGACAGSTARRTATGCGAGLVSPGGAARPRLANMCSCW